ncbi:MAG: ribonuclease R [Clostridiales bacterium]|nr:ribonuclease R [Clostridiales bacterium]
MKKKTSGGKSQSGKCAPNRKPSGGKKKSETPRAVQTNGEKLTGKIDASSKGFGFLVRDDGGEDLFIPARDMGTALGGDRVVCVCTGHNRGAGEARVVEIIERANESVVGTYTRGGGGGFVVADNTRLGSDIYVKNGRSGGAREGEKVVVKIVNYVAGRCPEGEVTEVLGYPDDAGVDILSVIRQNDLHDTFPRGVLDECNAIPDYVPAEKYAGRKDYRDECIITIDGDDSRDFDDAVTVRRTDDGGFRLGVHIADVAEYVRTGTKLNKEAYARGTSVYFPDRVLPMLPEKLSNGICSLNEGEDRLTLSVIMYIDNLGNIVRHKIREGIIRSRARMTYSNVAKILDGDQALRTRYAAIVPMLEDMKVLAALLRNKRTARGNIEFDIPECKVVLDENGRTVDVVKYAQLVSHKIIEEFMLACNETVAERFVKEKAPFVFRAHAVPPAEKVQAFIGFISALGLSYRGNVNEPQSVDFARFLASLDASVSGVVNRVALRSMSKATYEPKNIGHFGLAAPYYCHFTSPIRRYPDLMIHRIIKDFLHNGDKAFKKYALAVDEISKHCSEREKLAESAERKVDDIKKAEFMQSKIGEEYDGIISGVTEWGIFVELPNTVEGLIRTENLPGEGYAFNADLFRLDSPLHTFKLGDALHIKVSGVSGDRVSFLLAE